MDEQLYKKILALPKENIVNLLFMSLDEMAGYNGQSKMSAIMRSVDARESEDSLHGTIWNITQKELKKATNDFPL